ncbi:MAG TPA: Uma2 family endonuclease [Chloroflexi bacterium]|nr:Uma2 family endonuclease [Chloroflexota bacterium]
MATQGEKALALLREPGVLTDELRRELIELLLAPPQERRMSYEAFLEWADEDTLAEWVDGKVITYSPASKRHQEIADFLLVLTRLFVEHRDLGVVLSAPFQMKLSRSGREPDLIFVAKDHLDRLKTTYLDGPADLAVEIVSPESVGRDRGEKFYEYEEAGIPEYWLIDPLTERAEFYRLDDRGRYRLVPPDAEGVYRSAVLPGFWLKVAWLWHPPPVIEALTALGLLGSAPDSYPEGG